MYQNAHYTHNPLTDEIIGITIDINGMISFVPLDPANTDYQNIMQLVDEGKLVIEPAEELAE
jgi:hypothetical protein